MFTIYQTIKILFIIKSRSLLIESCTTMHDLIWAWIKVQYLLLAHGCVCKISLIIVLLLLYSYLLMSRATIKPPAKEKVIKPPAKEKVWKYYAKSHRNQHNTYCTHTHLATSNSTSSIPQIIT